jgi:hypothetical protein
VSTTPAANFATIFPSVVDTGGKFATGVNNSDGKFAAGVNANFRKKFETALMVYSGAWGKLIHEKNQESKIS